MESKGKQRLRRMAGPQSPYVLQLLAFTGIAALLSFLIPRAIHVPSSATLFVLEVLFFSLIGAGYAIFRSRESVGRSEPKSRNSKAHGQDVPTYAGSLQMTCASGFFISFGIALLVNAVSAHTRPPLFYLAISAMYAAVLVQI